jgi:hypothetical protein
MDARVTAYGRIRAGSADRVERHIGNLWTAGVAHDLAAGERWCPGVPYRARTTTSALFSVAAVA